VNAVLQSRKAIGLWIGEVLIGGRRWWICLLSRTYQVVVARLELLQRCLSGYLTHLHFEVEVCWLQGQEEPRMV
jgi:hypothetical protein